MTEKLLEYIHTASSQTFESLAFLEVFPAEEPVEYIDSDIMAVHLKMLEPYTGSLGLKTSKTFLSTVAEGLFSMPATEISMTELNDLLNELLNTIAGSFLSTALPAEKQFKLSLPAPGLVNAPMDSLNMCVWNFETDAGNFTIYGAGEMIEKL